MPAPLASSANTPSPASSNGTTRAARSDSGKDFSQLLQGGPSSAAPAASPGATPTAPASTSATTPDSNGQANAERRPDSEPPTDEAAALPTATPVVAADKDKPAATEDAPWPPLGLAGLMLAVATPTDAAAPPLVTPIAADGEDAAAPAALPAPAPALPATAQGAPAAANAMTTVGKPAAASTDEASALPLPEMILPGKRSERGEGSDLAALGDRATAPLLHAPAPAAVQDLKAALTAGTAIFNGEPTPKPVLGDEGFDQAIGARLGWLADQKIGHAHIRLSPDDMGPVDVRLQLNGDKVHASFSSPHVDVRQALESSLPRLRELLGEQGFQLAHADVGHQAPGGDGNAPGPSGNGGMAGDGEPTPGDANVSSAQLIRQRGLLDAYA